jgi:hypothetical protein
MQVTPGACGDGTGEGVQGARIAQSFFPLPIGELIDLEEVKTLRSYERRDRSDCGHQVANERAVELLGFAVDTLATPATRARRAGGQEVNVARPLHGFIPDTQLDIHLPEAAQRAH